MPLYEIETANHIIITWAEDEPGRHRRGSRELSAGAADAHYPAAARHLGDLEVGLGHQRPDRPLLTARDCLAKAAGDKLHAIRLYMQHTGADLERSRKAIESNMVMGW